MWRLADGPWQKSCPHRVKPSTFHRGKHRRNLKGEKQAKKDEQNPSHSLSDQLVKELLGDTDLPRIDEMQKILEDLLIQLAIVPSIEEGALADLQNLTVSGDGSILEPAASGQGKPTCSCRAQGIHRCDHDRIYSTATAKWCYDANKEIHRFGDRYYHLVVTQNGRDLPLLTIMPGGDESDYTLSLKAFDRFLKAIRENGLEMKITIFCGDGHHDSYAHYDYFEQKGVTPVIPLSQSSQKAYPHLLEDRGITTDTDGTPLCPAGCRMRYHQFNKAKRAHVFVCPVKRSTHRGGRSVYVAHAKECPREQICEPEKLLSPMVTIKSDTDPRLYPPIARGSARFERIMNQRSAAERCNSLNDSYGIERSCRSGAHALIRLTLINIVEHAVVRYMERVKKSSAAQLLEQALEQILRRKEYQDTG